MAACLHTSEDAFSTGQPGGFAQAELDALSFTERDLDSKASGGFGGLSQAELDALSAGCDEVTDGSEEFDDLLWRTKRTRQFIGREAADAWIQDAMLKECVVRNGINIAEEKSLCLPSGGLSQDELDALNVCAESPSSREGSEDELLFRVRRLRQFMGAETANAFAMSEIAEATNLKKDASDETATTASRSSSLPTLGLSQADLDAMCVVANDEPVQPDSPEGMGALLFQRRRRRHFMGLEQADAWVLEDMSKMAEAPNQQEASHESTFALPGGLSQRELDALTTCAEEGEEPCSPENSDAFLLRVRRARHFLGNEAADALVLGGMSKMAEATSKDNAGSEETASTASDSLCQQSTNTVPSRRESGHGLSSVGGLSQEELDSLCISAEEEAEEPGSAEGSDALLLQRRRARRFLGNEAADALVLGGRSKMAEATSQDKESTEDTVSTASGSLDLQSTNRVAFRQESAGGEWEAQEVQSGSTGSGSSCLQSTNTAAFHQESGSSEESASTGSGSLCLQSTNTVAFCQESGPGEKTASTGRVAPPRQESGGLTQEELDALGIEEQSVQPCSPPSATQKVPGKFDALRIVVDDGLNSPLLRASDDAPESPLLRVATPQRKRMGSIRLPSSPELGSPKMSCPSMPSSPVLGVNSPKKCFPSILPVSPVVGLPRSPCQ